jgi:uncharacterized protein (TIGR04255 family)
MRKGLKRTLGKSPLILVLAQVRFSPLMAMRDYIARIQDQLRIAGYPLNASVEFQEVTLAQKSVAASQRAHWEFLSKDSTISVIVSEGFVVVQTSSYNCFEDFLEKVTHVVSLVSRTVGGLLVQRVGLRYVDLIRPKACETWEMYVREGLRGFGSPHFSDGTALHLHQIVTRTTSGAMIVRLLQNREMAILPPDLATPTLAFPQIEPPTQGELLTIVDIDHFQECPPEDFSPEVLARMAWPLKTASYEVFRDSLVTEHAIEAWQ